MVPIFLADVDHLAFNPSEEMLEDRRGRLAFEMRLAAQRVASTLGFGEEFLRDCCLTAIEYMKSGNAALLHAAEDLTLLPQRGHEQRRFE